MLVEEWLKENEKLINAIRIDDEIMGYNKTKLINLLKKCWRDSKSLYYKR